jgi:hypothetical protein
MTYPPDSPPIDRRAYRRLKQDQKRAKRRMQQMRLAQQRIWTNHVAGDELKARTDAARPDR